MKVSLYIYITFCLILLSGCIQTKEDLLTKKEREWLNNHPQQKIAINKNTPPFQFETDKNTISGISIDILQLLEKKLSYRFKKVNFSNWKEILNAGKQKEIDVILEIQKTTDRSKYFHFTQSYISLPHVILMRKDAQDLMFIDQMEGLKIAIVDNYAIHEHLNSLYPELSLIPFPDDLSCLQALSKQFVDAVITQQAYVTHLMHQENISDIKIVGNSGYDNVLAFGIIKEKAILARIINKGLKQISQKEKEQIYQSYIPLRYSPLWKNIFTIILILTGLLIICLLFFFIWNKTLLKKVNEKTTELNKAKLKAEESNHLKNSFLANMSHEIRTPLNAIQGFSELICNDDITLEKKKKYASIINSNCSSLTQLIDEILDLSLIESKQIKISYETFNLIQFLEEIINTYKYNISKNINLDFINTTHKNHFDIELDPIRMKQILNNLINNAIKFTSQGSIKIILQLQCTNEILICVQDTGIGIHPKDQNLIFERFRKIEVDKNTLYRGSGLGLNICKKLIELMNGKIWVESIPEEGSSFFFTLPIRLNKINKLKS
jgi:two-component system sensor histidine kinase EvgS